MSDPKPSEDPSPALDEVIADEALRARVRRMVEERPRDPLWERLAKSPLTSIVLGFALTWGVGTSLTNKWGQAQLQQQRDLEEARRVTEARVSILTDAFGALEEHDVRIGELYQALEGRAPAEELTRLSRSIDDLFAQFGGRLASFRFKLRLVLPPSDYQQIFKAVDGLYVLLQEGDRILRDAVHERVASRPGSKVRGYDPRASNYLQAGAMCKFAIAEAIWEATLRPDDASAAAKPNEAREKALQHMARSCDYNAVPAD